MPLDHSIRKRITISYVVLFYGLMVYKWLSGYFLYQLQPFLFNSRSDYATWLLMNTGIHQLFLSSPLPCALFDTLFYSMPLLYVTVYLRRPRYAFFVALAMLVVNFVYAQCFTLYPSFSIEGFIAWLLMPFLFVAVSLKEFYFVLQALRYFFLYFFLSAGLWKLRQQGVFNLEQMSGVLLYQHAAYLSSSPEAAYSKFIYWLVNHPATSYLFYLSATLCELAFAIGFFTKRFDKLLIGLFVLFLVFDQLLMRIGYWEVVPLLLTLIFSRYTLPKTEKPLLSAAPLS